MLKLAAQQRGWTTLTFVINCNLQRLDGPVRVRSARSSRARAFFKEAPAGTSSRSSGAAAGTARRRQDDTLVHLMNETLDGDYQTFRANDGVPPCASAPGWARPAHQGPELDRRPAHKGAATATTGPRLQGGMELPADRVVLAYH